MPDEQAFLDALKANPADDTTRLVYADWLDEQGEAAKAEYLRLVAVLAQTCDDCTREQPEVARLLELAGTLPEEWRVPAGSRFAVVDYGGCDPDKKISTIKVIREQSGSSLTTVREAVETPPSRILDRVTVERAFPACEMIREAGGGEVHIHRAERTELPLEVKYTITASLWDWGDHPEEALTGFAQFLSAALGVGPDRARELAAERLVTIEDQVEAPHARSRLTVLRLLAPLWEESRPWYVTVDSQPIPSRRRAAI
jgi:uncharacterized protein (TIGR02996 family)